VEVEQVGASGLGEAPDQGGIPSLADVHHALEHPVSLARPGGGWPHPGWYGGRVNLGAPELIIVLIVILVLFGGAKLPKLARSLGQAQNEFKKGIQDGNADDGEPGKDA
jgi:sec-independent protein translocase protein TatA